MIHFVIKHPGHIRQIKQFSSLGGQIDRVFKYIFCIVTQFGIKYVQYSVHLQIGKTKIQNNIQLKPNVISITFVYFQFSSKYSLKLTEEKLATTHNNIYLVSQIRRVSVNVLENILSHLHSEFFSVQETCHCVANNDHCRFIILSVGPDNVIKLVSLSYSKIVTRYKHFALADLGGHARRTPPYGTQFFHFRIHFRQKVPMLEVHAPYGKSWIRHCFV